MNRILCLPIELAQKVTLPHCLTLSLTLSLNFSLQYTLYTSRKPPRHLLATGVPSCKEPGSAHEQTCKIFREELPHPIKQRRDELRKINFFVSLPLWWRLLISVDSCAEWGWPDTLGTLALTLSLYLPLYRFISHSATLSLTLSLYLPLQYVISHSHFISHSVISSLTLSLNISLFNFISTKIWQEDIMKINWYLS